MTAEMNMRGLLKVSDVVLSEMGNLGLESEQHKLSDQIHVEGSSIDRRKIFVRVGKNHNREVGAKVVLTILGSGLDTQRGVVYVDGQPEREWLDEMDFSIKEILNDPRNFDETSG